MTPQEIDRIQNAIRHIRTAVDVDPWAVEIAVEAMERQIPKKPIEPGPLLLFYKCPICKNSVNDLARYCAVCGCRLNWSEGE